MKRKEIRNLAIIAHVDHGKTTLLDRMLEQSGMLGNRTASVERVMDSNPLEKERGITIFSKNTSLSYQNTHINIVDTPGHADFGGEVERILNMVDGVLLLVDAFEGPMPQTKFVLKKALRLDLKPIVVINKIDRPNCRPDEVLNMVFDLFVALEANEEQLDFAHIFASAKDGFAKLELNESSTNLEPLYQLILEKIPAPEVQLEEPFQILVTDIQYDNYLGRLLLGRVNKGSVRTNQRIARIQQNREIEYCKISKLFYFEGLSRKEIEQAQAGEIILIAGIPNGVIGETLTDAETPVALPPIQVDPPTLSMNFRVNDSPFAGKEGKYVTSRHLRGRLEKETLANIALQIEDTDSMDEFKVSGRGELHLSILIENMRREGYEFSVSRPKVVYKEINGKLHEPVEELVIELPSDLSGVVIEELGKRKTEIQTMESINESTTKIEAFIPARGLIGFRSLFLTATKGEGIMYSTFHEYQPFRGETILRKHGVLIAHETGEAIPYSIHKLQDRGYFIIPPNIQVYEGMVVGANSREGDLVVNVCGKKQLTNVRASGKDDAVRIIPHQQLNLEQALEFINDDELVEVTPSCIRIRKRYLTENARKQMSKKKA